MPETSHCLNGHAGPHGRQDAESETFVVNARENPIHASDKSLSLGAKDRGHALFYSHDYNQDRIYGTDAPEPAHTAQDSNQSRNIAKEENGVMTVRRLTPTECARLQGFPDDHCRISWRSKVADQCPDGPQYKAYGNSMAVPVMRWIGERIEQVQAMAGPTRRDGGED